MSFTGELPSSKGGDMKILAALGLLTLAGCATTQDEWHWAKAGGSQQAFAIDHGQCRAQAFGVPGVSLLQAALVLDGCMHGKGWHKAPGPAYRSSAPLMYYPASQSTATTAPAKRNCDLVTDADGNQRFSCP